MIFKKFKLLKIKKPLSKLILLNLIFSLIGLEIVARFYYFYRSQIAEPLILELYPEMKNYLKYVNHYRDEVFKKNFLESYPRTKNKLKPINKKDYSFFIYSNYASCENKNNCKTLFLQGDSVGEGLGNSASDILFSKAVEKGWQVLHGGTSSFSPKNFSGQLAYFNSKGIKPDILITYIDQGDLGDDSIRYRNNYVLKKEPIKHYVVKPFKNSHLRIYNYETSSIASPFRLKPLSFKLMNLLYKYSLIRIFYWTDGKVNFTRTPGWSQITKPLVYRDKDKEEYFKQVLMNYVLTAKDLGVKELYFVSMPHPENIVDSISDDRKFKYSVASLVEDVVKMPGNSEDIDLFHISLKIDQNLFPCKGKDETCNGFYRFDDFHPELAGYKYMGKEIMRFISKNTNFMDFK